MIISHHDPQRVQEKANQFAEPTCGFLKIIWIWFICQYWCMVTGWERLFNYLENETWVKPGHLFKPDSWYKCTKSIVHMFDNDIYKKKMVSLWCTPTYGVHPNDLNIAEIRISWDIIRTLRQPAPDMTCHVCWPLMLTWQQPHQSPLATSRQFTQLPQSEGHKKI